MANTIVDTLKAKELLVVHKDGKSFYSSQLGNAIVWSGLAPDDGLTIFDELERARSQFNLESELHILYLVTPLSISETFSSLDWYQYMIIWQQLPAAFRKVGNLVGVSESILVGAVRGRMTNLKDPIIVSHLRCMQRFYW